MKQLTSDLPIELNAPAAVCHAECIATVKLGRCSEPSALPPTIQIHDRFVVSRAKKRHQSATSETESK